MGKMTHYTRDYFHVLDYGAHLDGVTDDSAALLAAVEDAKVGAVRGIVFIPPGVLYLGDPVNHLRVVASGITLRGTGKRSAIIRFADGRNTGMSLEGSDILVEHLGFTGDTANQGLLVEQGGKHRNVVKDCYFYSDSGVALKVSGGGKAGTTIRNNLFKDVYTGVQLSGVTKFTTIVDNIFEGWIYTGVRLNGSNSSQLHSEDVLISGNRFYGPRFPAGPGTGGYPIHSEGTGGVHRNVAVRGNQMRGTGEEWAEGEGTPDQLSFNNVDGLIIDNNSPVDGGENGITLEADVSNFVVSNNIVRDNDGAGIYCDGRDGSIVGNVLVGNGRNQSGDVNPLHRAGIVLGYGDSANVYVGGNRAHGHDIGVSIRQGADNIVLGDNVLSGNGVDVYDERV